MAKDGILRLNILIFITEVKYLGQKKLTMLQDMFMSKKTLYFEQIPGPTEVNDINNASKNNVELTVDEEARRTISPMHH